MSPPHNFHYFYRKDEPGILINENYFFRRRDRLWIDIYYLFANLLIVYTCVQDKTEAGGSGPGDEGEEEDGSVDEGGDEASSNSTEDDNSSTDQLVRPSGRQVTYFTLFNRYSFLLIL
jgi:hypothetical protein